MNKKKELLAILLIACLIITAFPLNIFATEEYFSSDKEVYTDEELGFTLERNIDDDKITVFVKTLKGVIQNTIVNDNGKIYLDGNELNNNFIDNLSSKSSNLDHSSSLYSTTESIDWGSWHYSSDEISTGGLSTAIIAGIIAATAPWVGITIIGVIAAAVAGKYDTIQIEWQIRYGDDDEFFYYERYTDFYGDGTHIGGPYYDTGKEPLK
ncbi:MAG: hypothetical protein FH761_13685 [Firmicutes bacterium]|nr:hypothetical protein [Bacillota bacterium]